MARSYTNKCAKCGVEFVTSVPQTKLCPNCVNPLAAYNRAYRAAHKCKDKRKRDRSYEFSKPLPIMDNLTYAQIRARARRVHVEAGWRGQRVAGGGSNHRLTFVEVAQ